MSEVSGIVINGIKSNIPIIDVILFTIYINWP